MNLKAPTTYIASFLVVAILILLMADTTRASEQADRSASGPPPSSPVGQAEALFQNALLLFDKQEREPARLQLQEAMRLWVALREPAKAANAALQIGDRCRQARQYYEALNYYREALDIRSLPAALKADALNAVAFVYAELYLRDMAEAYFNRALEQARSGGNLPAQMRALIGLADLYHQQGAIEKALASVTQAQRLSQQGEADAALSFLHGQLKQKQGAVAEAEGAFKDALAIYRKSGDPAGQVKVLCAWSALSLSASQKQAALKQAEEAVKLAAGETERAATEADHRNAWELQWRAWLSRARAERALGQSENARRSYLRAINYIKGIWWAVYIATEASAIAFREEAQAAYREFVDLLMECGEIAYAYEVADEAKARTLLNFSGARRKNPPSEDAAQAATLRQLSESIIRLRLELLGSKHGPHEQAKLQREIESAESKRREMQLLAEMAHSRERLVWTQPARVEKLKQQMAGDQGALVEFFLGEQHSFVWFFTQGEVYYDILPPRQQIEDAVRSYLNLLAAAPNPLLIERDLAKLRGRAETLFATLFGRLASHLEAGQRLMVVPDGLLHYLPFEALIHNGHYLIEAHEISYNPSASMLNLWQESAARTDNRDKMELFALGDPLFEATPMASGKPSKHGSFNSARRTGGVRDLRLAPLPRTRDEVQAIAGLFPADRRRVLLGRQSTESAVKHEALRRYRRLHFATHSLMDDESPARSAIVLTADHDAEEDGLLDVGEISRLDLDCDLVVISACQTGRGKLLTGEGVVGLSRAFLYAGARAVVVSLWNVSDLASSQLMKSFYQNQTGGMTNAAALRRAKLQMLGGSLPTRHPYYWSAFVFVGQPSR